MNKETLKKVRILYDYMKINDELEKVDIIIGCGCSNLEIPQRCAQLLIQGYSNQIIFTGGLGKYTKHIFSKTEAEIFADIAMKCGVDRNCILLEEESTNLPQNFINTKELIRREKIVLQSMIIVHSSITTRRTLATAKVYFPDTRMMITTPQHTFEEYIEKMQQKEKLEEAIHVLVGNIQRMIITPSIGYQIEMQVPSQVIEAYQILKKNGYHKYIYTVEQIQHLIQKHGLREGQLPNYFN